MGVHSRTYCVENDCPVKESCLRGMPNHPKTDPLLGVSPRVPQLTLAWYGDSTGQLGKDQVAPNYWCDKLIPVTKQ